MQSEEKHIAAVAKQLFKLYRGKNTVDQNIGTPNNSSNDTPQKGKTQLSKCGQTNSPQTTIELAAPDHQSIAGENT